MILKIILKSLKMKFILLLMKYLERRKINLLNQIKKPKQSQTKYKNNYKKIKEYINTTPGLFNINAHGYYQSLNDMKNSHKFQDARINKVIKGNLFKNTLGAADMGEKIKRYLLEHYSTFEKISKVYLEYLEKGVFKVIIFTDTNTYDYELMDSLFDIEKQIDNNFSQLQFFYDYIPGKYIEEKDIINDKSFLIYKG